MKKVLFLTLLIVCLCATLVACGEKDPPPEICIHTYDDGVVTQAPTCIAKGVMTYSCTKCEDSYTEDIAKVDHVYGGVGVVTKEPTCKELGVIETPCTTEGCTATEKGTVPKIDHVPDETKFGTNDNMHWNECSNCGSQTGLTAHTWDEGTVKTAATCLATGIQTKTCTVCLMSRDFELSKTNHVWDDGTVSKAASTTTCEAGSATYACTTTGCNATKTAALPSKVQHTLTSEVVNAQMKYSCSTCSSAWTSETFLLWDATGATALEGIEWALNAGYGSTNPTVVDGYYAMVRSATDNPGASAQAQYWFTKSRITDANQEKGTVGFLTLDVKAPEGGIMENGWNIQLVDDKSGATRWSDGFCVRGFLECDGEGVLQGGTDIEGRRIQLGTVTKDAWTKIVVAIELDDGKFYWSYFINGTFRGTAVADNTIVTKAINSYYFTGTTVTAGTGLLLDNLGFAYANNDEFLPVNLHMEHNWVKGETFAPATETCQYGYTAYSCPDCGAVKEDDFVQSTVAHTYDPTLTYYTTNPVAEDTENKVEAVDGEWTLVCKDCNWHEDKTGSFADHDHAYNLGNGETNEDGTKVTCTCTVPGCEQTQDFDVETPED